METWRAIEFTEYLANKKIQRCAPSSVRYPEWRTILKNHYSLKIAREDAHVTKETRKFLRLFDHAISMITGQPTQDPLAGSQDPLTGPQDPLTGPQDPLAGP